MVHYIALYKLSEHTGEGEIEKMIRVSRARLHRVNEAHNFRSGRSIREENKFAFFLSADFESLDKLKMFKEDPEYLKFDNEVVQQYTDECRELFYETEPGKDPRYS